MYDRQGLLMGAQAEFKDLERMVAFLSPVQLPKRPKNSKVRTLCYDLCVPWDRGMKPKEGLRQRSMQLFRNNIDDIVVCVVILNMLILCTRTRDMSDEHTLVVDVIDALFVVFYVAEVAIKVTAYRFKHYFKSVWNVVDAFIVFMTLIAVIFGGKFARIFRVLRAIRLLKGIPVFNMITTVMFQSLLQIWNIVCVLMMIMFAWSIYGIEAFGDLRYGGPY